MEHGFKIQPMVINGGHIAMPSGSGNLEPKVDFKLRVLDPVDVTEFEGLTELKDQVRMLMNKELQELRHN